MARSLSLSGYHSLFLAVLEVFEVVLQFNLRAPLMSFPNRETMKEGKEGGHRFIMKMGLLGNKRRWLSGKSNPSRNSQVAKRGDT